MKRLAIRQGNPQSLKSIERCVERYGSPNLEDIKTLMEMLDENGYDHRIELHIKVGALDRVIDNQHDLELTIENIKRNMVE